MKQQQQIYIKICASYFIVRPIFYGMLTSSIKLIKNPRVSNWKRLRLITNLRVFELYFVYVCTSCTRWRAVDVIIMVHSLEMLTTRMGGCDGLKSSLNFCMFQLITGFCEISGSCLKIVVVRLLSKMPWLMVMDSITNYYQCTKYNVFVYKCKHIRAPINIYSKFCKIERVIKERKNLFPVNRNCEFSALFSSACGAAGCSLNILHNVKVKHNLRF